MARPLGHPSAAPHMLIYANRRALQVRRNAVRRSLAASAPTTPPAAGDNPTALCRAM